MTLVEVLADDVRRRAVAKDGALVVDQEVAKKTGIRAAALKAGYRTVKKLKPGIIEESLFVLLPHFAPAVDPHWAKAVEGGDPHRYFRDRAADIAESMLQVTDARAERARNKVMLRVYKGLRGQALKYTTESVPALSPLIDKYVS